MTEAFEKPDNNSMNAGTATNPGYKTSELWVTLLSMILTMLAVRGVIQASDVNPLLNAFMQVYGGIVGLLTIFGIAAKYINSRTTVKNKMLDGASQTQPEANLPLDNPVKTGA